MLPGVNHAPRRPVSRPGPRPRQLRGLLPGLGPEPDRSPAPALGGGGANRSQPAVGGAIRAPQRPAILCPHQQRPGLHRPAARQRAPGPGGLQPQSGHRAGDRARPGSRAAAAVERRGGHGRHHGLWAGAVQPGPDEAPSGLLPGPVEPEPERAERHHGALHRPVWATGTGAEGVYRHQPDAERLEGAELGPQRHRPALIHGQISASH